MENHKQKHDMNSRDSLIELMKGLTKTFLLLIEGGKVINKLDQTLVREEHLSQTTFKRWNAVFIITIIVLKERLGL